jgi:hypothetical protein
MKTKILVAICITVFALLNHFKGYCQNMVPNPSFEEYSHCPDDTIKLGESAPYDSNFAFISKNDTVLKDWFGCADYYGYYVNTCSYDTTSPLPHIKRCPRTGHGFATLDGYEMSRTKINIKNSVISVELLDTMQRGVKYYIEVWVRANLYSSVVSNTPVYASFSRELDRDHQNFKHGATAYKLTNVRSEYKYPFTVIEQFKPGAKEEWLRFTGHYVPFRGGEKYLSLLVYDPDYRIETHPCYYLGDKEERKLEEEAGIINGTIDGRKADRYWGITSKLIYDIDDVFVAPLGDPDSYRQAAEYYWENYNKKDKDKEQP